MYNLLVARSRWCGPIMTLSVSDFWLAHSRSEPNCYSTTNPFRFGMNLSSPALSKKLSTNNTVQCHFQFPCRAIEFVHYRYSTADYNTFNSISSVWIYSPSLTLRLYEIPLLPLTVVTAGHSSYMSKRGCQCLSRSSFSAIAAWITGFASKRGLQLFIDALTIYRRNEQRVQMELDDVQSDESVPVTDSVDSPMWFNCAYKSLETNPDVPYARTSSALSHGSESYHRGCGSKDNSYWLWFVRCSVYSAFWCYMYHMVIQIWTSHRVQGVN